SIVAYIRSQAARRNRPASWSLTMFPVAGASSFLQILQILTRRAPPVVAVGATATSACPSAGLGGLGQVVRRVDQGYVGERLRKVARQASGSRVVLLGQEPDVVTECQE